MILHIVTPEKKESIEIEWIELNTPIGNMIIQEGHAPTILSLSPGKPYIYLVPDGNPESRNVISGFARITRSDVTLLLSIAS